MEDKKELLVKEEEVVVSREESVEGKGRKEFRAKVDEVLPCYETLSAVLELSSKPLADPPP